MKRSTLLFTALAFALWAVPLFAQGHSNGHAAGGASGAGSSIGHGSTGTSGHGNPNISGGGGRGGSSTGTLSQQKQLDKFLAVPSSNPKLFSKISGMLPAGTDLSGFNNLGQLISTVHVYNNLGLATKNPPVTFTEFATAVKSKSLGAAIKQFDPTANSSSETKKGKKQANADLNEKES